MKSIRMMLMVVFAVILSCGLAVAQDEGNDDSLYFEYEDTWIIDDLEDTTFFLTLYAWTDQDLSALSLPFWLRVDTTNVLDSAVWDFHTYEVEWERSDVGREFAVRWCTSVDSLIYIDTFLFDENLEFDFPLEYSRSCLDTTVDHDSTIVSWGMDGPTADSLTYNGFSLGIIRSISPPVIPTNERTKIGQLRLKMNIDASSEDKILPAEFDVIVDTAMFPKAVYFKYSVVSGGGDSYQPLHTEQAKFHVVIADTIFTPDDDSLFLDADDNDPATIPAVYALAQNYPNPCNPSTTVKYSLKTRGYVELSIYNILGRKVRTLVSGEKDAGWHEVLWDGKDDGGANVASGVYFYKMKSGQYINTKKMLILK